MKPLTFVKMCVWLSDTVVVAMQRSLVDGIEVLTVQAAVAVEDKRPMSADEIMVAEFRQHELSAAQVKVSLLSQSTGGVARAAFEGDIYWTDEGIVRGGRYVLKIDPLGRGSALVPGSMVREYEWIEVVWQTRCVLVPEPLAVERSGAVLGAPFMLVAKVPGDADRLSIFQANFDDEQRRSIVAQGFEILGNIVSLTVDELDASAGVNCTVAVDDVWRVELDRGEELLDSSDQAPLPVLRSAIRPLRHNLPPAPSRLAVVHGDYRLGNYQYSPAGIHSIIDWVINWVFVPAHLAGELVSRSPKHPGNPCGVLVGKALRITSKGKCRHRTASGVCGRPYVSGEEATRTE